jgi:hypothetical protein
MMMDSSTTLALDPAALEQQPPMSRIEAAAQAVVEATCDDRFPAAQIRMFTSRLVRLVIRHNTEFDFDAIDALPGWASQEDMAALIGYAFDVEEHRPQNPPVVPPQILNLLLLLLLPVGDIDSISAEADASGDVETISPTGVRQASKQASAPPPPLRDDLAIGNLQIWHNTNALQRIPEWKLKLRADRKSLPYHPTREYWVGFAAPVRAREVVRRHILDGKISPFCGGKLIASINTMAPTSLFGLFGGAAYQGKRPKGVSSNARIVFPDHWAVLHIDHKNIAPDRVELYLGCDDTPIAITRFYPPSATAPNGPGWIALVDPDELHTSKKELEKMRKQANNNTWMMENPRTWIAQEVARVYQAKADAEAERDALRQRVAFLESQQTVSLR